MNPLRDFTRCLAPGLIGIWPYHHVPADEDIPGGCRNGLRATGPGYNNMIRQLQLAGIRRLFPLDDEDRRIRPECQTVESIERPWFRKGAPAPTLRGARQAAPGQRQDRFPGRSVEARD